MLFLAVCSSAFITSVISGVFGLAGGMIFMVILAAMMPLHGAMILHALNQIVSNAWRCMLWRRHIVWRVLPFYFAGIAAGFLMILMVAYVPDKGAMYLMMGCLPLIALGVTRWMEISIMNRGQTFLTAVLLCYVQMTTGVVGPLLDLLYNRSPLTRQQILATKALTQTTMHLLRVGYYGLFLPAMLDQSWARALHFEAWMVVVMLGCTILGTTSSTLILKRFSDERFKQYSRYLIAVVSAYCVFRGLQEMGVFPA